MKYTRQSSLLEYDRAQQRKKSLALIAVGFILGFVISSAAILNTQLLLDRLEDQSSRSDDERQLLTTTAFTTSSSSSRDLSTNRGTISSEQLSVTTSDTEISAPKNDPPSRTTSSPALLQDIRILVAIAAFDFTQIPHLEEVLDSYHDVCIAGAKVDVVIHATVAYPVTYIDMLNSRFTCGDFSIEIVLKQSSLRLHLVDCHRQLFYDKINEYDLFIYTEEDIQVTPRTVATYLQESRRIRDILDNDPSSKYNFSDFNVGIVRYEYNFPSNVVIDDKTRHAVQNVTRVYWEHSSFKPPIVPNTLDSAPQGEAVSDRYAFMKNHHQGMFLATRDLLLAWKGRKNCNFDVATTRPGTHSQPAEGTQRVWMSSQQLLGSRHCNVQQVLPKDKFGALTVLHVPNKNYRRVGKYRTRKFSDGTEEFDVSPDLLTALQLHLAMRKAWPSKPQIPYRGPIKMSNAVSGRRPAALLERRMREYRDYVRRGGVLSDNDFQRTLLVEDS